MPPDAPPRRRRVTSDRGATSGGTGTGVPPRGEGDGSASTVRTRSPSSRSLEGRLTEFFSVFALGFEAVGDAHCAQVIADGAPNLAEAWSNLARENAGVKRVLDRLLEGGAWGGVIFSTLAVAIPIAQHHGAWPETWFNPFGGSPPPSATVNGNQSGSVPVPPTPPPRGRVGATGEPDRE